MSCHRLWVIDIVWFPPLNGGERWHTQQWITPSLLSFCHWSLWQDGPGRCVAKR